MLCFTELSSCTLVVSVCWSNVYARTSFENCVTSRSSRTSWTRTSASCTRRNDSWRSSGVSRYAVSSTLKLVFREREAILWVYTWIRAGKLSISISKLPWETAGLADSYRKLVFQGRVSNEGLFLKRIQFKILEISLVWKDFAIILSHIDPDI